MPNHRPDRAVAAAVVAASIALAGCGGDGRDLPPARDPLPATTTTPPTPPTFPSGEASFPPPSAGAGIVIDELTSVETAIARVTGSGAQPGDPVSVDGLPADVITFEVGPDEGFDLRVFVEDEGAHTVCVGDACGRVYTLAPDAETPDEVIAKIDEAIVEANTIVAFDELFPGWTVAIGGLLAGTGGSTDVETKRITIYRNRGRSVDDFVRTIVHEYGHVADHEWLDDGQRSAFAIDRGFTADTPWQGEGSHRIDDWVAAPSEDFAEAMASWWSDGRWPVRTAGGELTADQRDFIAALPSAP